MVLRSLVLASAVLAIALQGGCAPRGGSPLGAEADLPARRHAQARAGAGRRGSESDDSARERQDLRVTLDNGLRLVLRPTHLARVAALHAFVDYGTADEPEDLPGLAHLFEHLLLRGPPGHPVTRLAGEIETAGGQLSAWTTPDQTVYRVVLPSRELPLGVSLLGEALRRPALDLGRRRQELRAITDEIHEAEAQPARLLSQTLLRGAFPDHPYRRPVLGTAQSLTELTRPDRGRPTLPDLFAGAYTAERITLVLTGDFDPGAARPLLQDAFAGVPRGGRDAARARSRPGRLSGPGRKDGPRVAAYEHSGEQFHLGLALPMPGARAPAESLAAAALIAAILGQGEGARLPAEMSGRGLAGEVSAALFAPREGGLLLLTAVLNAAQLGEAAQVLLGEVRRLQREDVPAAELDRARELLLADAAYGIETPAGLGRRLGFFATLAAEGEAAYERALRDMTPERLRALLAPFLQREAPTLAALVPRRGPGHGQGHGGSAAPATDGGRKGQRRAQVLLQAVTPADPAETERLLRAAIARAAQPEAPPPGKAGPGRWQEGEVVRHRLRGGGTLLILAEHGAPTVAMRALWPGGLRNEDERSAGANHLLARLLVSAREAGCSRSEMASLGGTIEAQAGPDSFGLRAQVLSQHAERGLQVLLGCLRRPALSEAEVEAERWRVLAALRHREDTDLGEAALRLFLRALFPRHPYRQDPLGTEASVASLSRRRLLEFYRRHYGPEHLTLAVVGDVDPAGVIARVEASLAQRPADAAPVAGGAEGAEAPPQSDPPPQAPVQVFLPLPKGQQQAHLILGFRGLSVKDPDRHALEVLRTILRGGADEGRLGRALRDRRGLVVQVGEQTLTGLDAGYVGFSLSTFPDRAEAAQAALRDELRRLVDHPVTAEELARAKRYLVGAHEMGLQRRDQLAAALSQGEAFGLGWAAYRSFPEAISRVEVQDVRRVARRVLDEGRMVLAAVLPEALTPAAGRRLVEKAPAPGAGPPPPRSNPPLSKVPIKSPGKKARRKRL